jgi:hypothetical protein
LLAVFISVLTFENNTINTDTLLIGQEILIELWELGIRQSDTGEDLLTMIVKEDSAEFQYGSITDLGDRIHSPVTPLVTPRVKKWLK